MSHLVRDHLPDLVADGDQVYFGLFHCCLGAKLVLVEPFLIESDDNVFASEPFQNFFIRFTLWVVNTLFEGDRQLLGFL